MTIPMFKCVNNHMFKRYIMNSKIKRTLNFSFTIAVITFVLAAIFSVISSSILNHVIWIAGGIVVFVVIVFGIVFDLVVIVSSAGDEDRFLAVVAVKEYGVNVEVAMIENVAII